MQLSTYVPSYMEVLNQAGEMSAPEESLVIGEIYTPPDLDGSFFLTCSRAATRDQVERGYRAFPDFLRLKRRYDPELRFRSDWWRHYAPMLE